MRFNIWEDSGKGYLEFNKWQGVDVMFSLRGKEEAFLNYLVNRGKVVSLHQVHSARVFVVAGSGEHVLPTTPCDGDGLLIDKPGSWLTITVADCLPIYIYDKNKKVVGLVHAGKKGTQSFILRNAISLLYQRFNSAPADISILFGPSICPKCYDYDLWGNNVSQAKVMGVTNIINPKICTAEFPSAFYSYRRERGTSGRMYAAIRKGGVDA